jgi:acyl carrier protein
MRYATGVASVLPVPAWREIIMEIPPKLKEYLDKNRSVYNDSLPPVADPDEPLHVDSLGVIRLVAFLENEFGYRIEDEELVAENFATLRKLGDLLATKTPTGPTV